VIEIDENGQITGPEGSAQFLGELAKVR